MQEPREAQAPPRRPARRGHPPAAPRTQVQEEARRRVRSRRRLVIIQNARVMIISYVITVLCKYMVKDICSTLFTQASNFIHTGI